MNEEPKRKFGGRQPGAGRPKNPNTVPNKTIRVPIPVYDLLRSGKPVVIGDTIHIVPRSFEP